MIANRYQVIADLAKINQMIDKLYWDLDDLAIRSGRKRPLREKLTAVGLVLEELLLSELTN